MAPTLDHVFARPFRGRGDRIATRIGRAIGIHPVQVTEGLGVGRAKLDAPLDAVVLGGGLAGASAAVRLAERGFRVRVLERCGYLGGKLGAWPIAMPDGSTVVVEHGFHGFFLQYYNLFRLFLDCGVDPADLPVVDDYAIVAKDGRAEGLRDYPRVAPFNVLSMARRSPFMNMREARRMKGFSVMRDAFLRYDPERTFADWDGISFAELSERMGLVDTGFDAVFKVFGHSFFSESSQVSAAEIAKNFHFFFFANPEGLVFRYCRSDFEQAIWTPVQRRIEALGGTVELGVEALSIGRDESGRFAVEVREAAAPGGSTLRIACDAVVVATDPPGTRALLERSTVPGLAALAPRVPPAQPYAVVRLWADRMCSPSRAWFTSLHGHYPLDSVTLYHRMERASEEWARANGGAVYELHSYTPEVSDARDPERLVATLEERFFDAFPELRGMRILHRFPQVRWDFPGFPPGGAASRLRTAAPVPGIAFAGDWVRLSTPAALMEGAVTSGLEASNEIGRLHGLAPQENWTVPPRGVLTRVLG